MSIIYNINLVKYNIVMIVVYDLIYKVEVVINVFQ